MIIYRCDRCGKDTTPDKLYEVELIFTPHDLDDGGLNTDKEDRNVLGHCCADCTDVIQPLAHALVKASDVVRAEANVRLGRQAGEIGMTHAESLQALHGELATLQRHVARVIAEAAADHVEGSQELIDALSSLRMALFRIERARRQASTSS
jgi:hypothetical protein